MAYELELLEGGDHNRQWEHHNEGRVAAQRAFGTPGGAPLAAGWEGSVMWSQTGPVVTVMIGVRRTAGSQTVSAWNSVSIATGLPVPAVASVPGALAPQWGAVQSNSAEVAANVWAFGLSGGSVNLQARWTDRTLAQSTWYSGSFSYLTRQ